MKHVILIIALVMFLYVGWNFADSTTRDFVKQFLKHHGWRVLLILGAVFMAVAFSVYTISPNIF